MPPWVARVRSSRGVPTEILGVPRILLPLRVAAPFEMPARHIRAVAHPEQQRALRAVDVFVQLARRMHHECAGHDVDRLLGRAHPAAALEAEIDLGRIRMTMIGADLAGFPARDRDVALADLAEDLLDVAGRVPLLLLEQTEDVHGVHLHATLDRRNVWLIR